MTVLALSPIGEGLFAAPASFDAARLPLFTVVPYMQPGPGSVLQNGRESIVELWRSEQQHADCEEHGNVTGRWPPQVIVAD